MKVPRAYFCPSVLSDRLVTAVSHCWLQDVKLGLPVPSVLRVKSSTDPLISTTDTHLCSGSQRSRDQPESTDTVSVT